MAEPLSMPAGPLATLDPFPAEIARAVGRRSALWEDLRGASVFFTGGTGLFGRWLLASALEANRRFHLGMRVWLLTRDPSAFKARDPRLAADPALALIEGDIATFLPPDARFDFVIHGATTSAHETFRGEKSLGKFDTIVAGTRRVLDLVAARGITRLLFLSSGAVYHQPAGGMATIPESYLAAPATDNIDGALAHAKRTAEYLCAEYANDHGFEFCAARCFSFVGPHLPLDLHYAIGNFIQQALRDDYLMVKGDGSPIRSYLYLGDLVTWLFTLLLRPGNHRIYNVGSDRAVSILELANMVRNELAPGKEVRVLARAAADTGSTLAKTYVPDIARARADFGLDVWTDLAQAIRLTAVHAAYPTLEER